MAICQQSKKPRDQSLIALTYFFLNAEHQMTFNPDGMDIEQKLITTAIWILVGTLYQIQPNPARNKYIYASNQCLIWLSKLTPPVTALSLGTVR